MRFSPISRFTQDDPNPANITPSPPPSTDPSDTEFDEALTLHQFRRLLADYRRAGYELAQHLQQTLFP